MSPPKIDEFDICEEKSLINQLNQQQISVNFEEIKDTKHIVPEKQRQSRSKLLTVYIFCALSNFYDDIYKFVFNLDRNRDINIINVNKNMIIQGRNPISERSKISGKILIDKEKVSKVDHFVIHADKNGHSTTPQGSVDTRSIDPESIQIFFDEDEDEIDENLVKNEES